MYLRDLAVSAVQPGSDIDEMLRYFTLSTHVVVELVLAWIPRNTVVLDNLAKLNVMAGEPPESEHVYSSWQGVGTYYSGKFDFREYARLSEAEQHGVILELLSSAFASVANISGSDISACVAAISHVRNTGLPLPEIGSPAFWELMPRQKKRSKRLQEDIAFIARLVASAKKAPNNSFKADGLRPPP